ncbi:MAG: class I SAM-dependent methyltransferase [Acidimicrobiales bacterium]
MRQRCAHGPDPRGAGEQVSGVDLTPSGIERARRDNPGAPFFVHDLGEPLPAERPGRLDVVVSAEVIEHLFLPRTPFDAAARPWETKARSSSPPRCPATGGTWPSWPPASRTPAGGRWPTSVPSSSSPRGP